MKHGWLERVIRGVYRRPLPEGLSKDSGIPWETTLLSLQQIMGYHIHPGAESALEVRGYSHYLRFGRMPYIHLYGKALPWLTRLQGETKIIIHQNNLFGDNPVGLVPHAIFALALKLNIVTIGQNLIMKQNEYRTRQQLAIMESGKIF